MFLKRIASPLSVILLASTLTGGYTVQADDHKYDNEQEYYGHDGKSSNDDYNKKYEKDDHDKEKSYFDDDYDKKNEMNKSIDPLYSKASMQDTWNNWTRTTSLEKGKLPFNDAKNVTLKIKNKKDSLSFTIIPRDGELFVPGKAVAKVLGGKATIYVISQILEVTNNNTELILKANTNVAYENNSHLPLPAVSFSMNGDVYVPISVITNALGYSVKWQQKNNQFICSAASIQ